MEKMSMEDYLAAREQVCTTSGEAVGEPAAQQKQELARLFVRSGWTRQELATVEKLSPSSIVRHLRFGQFVNFLHSKGMPAAPLTAYTFRAYWDRTNKADDPTRFAAVQHMLAEEADLPKPPRANAALAKKLRDTYGDGAWHGLRLMAAKLQADQTQVQRMLDGMRRRGVHATYCERRKGRKDEGGWQYRLLPHHGHTIPYEVLKHETAPIIAELKAQGQKNMATISPGSVTELAYRLEKLLDKLAQ